MTVAERRGRRESAAAAAAAAAKHRPVGGNETEIAESASKTNGGEGERKGA